VLLRTVLITLPAAASGGAASTAPPPILVSPFADEDPFVSPNGKRVGFVSERGGGPGIYDVGIDGAGLRRLDPPPHQIDSLGWS
jgi:Tol biopolymer transport system component